jgi:hypothetical protein
MSHLGESNSACKSNAAAARSIAMEFRSGYIKAALVAVDIPPVFY